jgi:16S rRNA (guanine527-N7)-methyltransferase
VDLGSGAGLPGLPLALVWPNTHWILLDAGANRTAFLREAVGWLAVSDRVEVVHLRAEEAGRGNLRGSAESVLARSFGAPAVTAECASPLLRVGGTLVVAEPPGGDTARWNVDGLALLGMKLGPAVTAPTAFQVVLQAALCPPRFPRRTGVPGKRPLF